MNVCTIPSSWLCRTQDRCEDAGMVWYNDKCEAYYPADANYTTQLAALNGLNIRVDEYLTDIYMSVRATEYVVTIGFCIAFGLILFVPVWKYLFKLIKNV